MSKLDRLIARARDTEIRRELVIAGARPPMVVEPIPRVRRWWVAIGAGLGVAALGIAWAAHAPPGREPPADVPAVIDARDASPVSAPSPSLSPSPSPAPAPVVRVPVPTPVHAPAREHLPALVPTAPPLVPAPPSALPPAAPSLDLDARWRHARALRAAGDLRGALAECLVIADAHDAQWSPIAELEAARIAVGPLADVHAAIAWADRVLAEWPGSALAATAGELRCRARTELGLACP